MSVSIYPEFRPLTINDLAVFKRAFRENPPSLSEFTFTNLYAWRRAYKFTFTRLDDFLIVCSGSEKEKRFLNPVGRGDRKAAIEKVMNQSGGIFFRLPEETKAVFDADSRFRIKADRDNCDYLYASSDLITLSGKKYDGKRNLIKKFRAMNDYEYIRLDKANVGLCLKFQEEWCSLRNCDSVEGLRNERQAIREMIENFSSFELIGGAIKVNGKIEAVAIAQELNPDTLVVHAQKASPNITGLYQAIMQEFLAREAGRFKYVNLEQDLGIEGLRKAKLSYHPAAMINKYTLTPA